MKLTTFTDYSLRVLIFLAARPQQRATIAEVAVAFGISQNHLTKVVHFLGRQGWIETVRGKGGGMVLARPAHAIGIGEVVREAEGAVLAAECFSPESHGCSIAPVCRLRGVLGEAIAAFHAVLDRATLADVAANGPQVVHLLFGDGDGLAASRSGAGEFLA
jgi:Rrf2 family nitric oxide-sensitive transcriptional repressor